MPRLSIFAATTLAVLLAGCGNVPTKDDDSLQREALAGTEKPVPVPLALNDKFAPDTRPASPDVTHGSGQYVRPVSLAKAKPAAGGQGAVTFNFENQPVEAVVKAILGDLLHENYSIVPGVQGNISFSTAQPVTNQEALPILEMLLSWTGNALVNQSGRYVVMPTKDAVGGNVVPSLGAGAPRGGLQARLFPLRFISATEMQKLLKPFARADSILLADPSRNVVVMAGTGEEMANYQRTIAMFDVDWLKNTSVGVFNLQRASVKDLLPQLNAFFGPKGDTPLAGMLRFIPIERTNSLVVISQQPAYLDEVKSWLDRIDHGGGNEPQLYVYDVRNVQASDLAQYLGNIYGGGGSGGKSDSGGKVGLGLTSGSLGGGDNTNNRDSGMGSTTGSFGSAGSTGSGGFGGTGSSFGSNGSSTGGTGGTGGGAFGNAGGSSNGGSSSGGGNGNTNASVTTDEGVRISAVDNNNQLLVRARPSQWTEIEQAIQRLDSVPLQVQIETRILEVTLTNQFSFGVQWYLEGLIGTTDGKTPGQPGNNQQYALGGGGANTRNPPTSSSAGDAFFYSFANDNLSVAVRALETSGNTKILSAPSLVVLNNQQAAIQVGDQVPITTTSFDTTTSTNGTYNNVQYLSTGVILNVRPRVNPGGLVYMQINQQVSTPTGATSGPNSNPTIAQRQVATQVAVQSGQTVLLGGLIKQNDNVTDTGIPGLNRIPILGRLFGTTSRSRDRTELVVLITPRVITSSSDAKAITDEYQLRMESLAPLRAQPLSAAPARVPAQVTPIR